MNTFVIKLKTNKKNKTYTDLFLDRNIVAATHIVFIIFLQFTMCS